MVRIKERYLLVNILYPRDGAAAAAGRLDAQGRPVPDFVAMRRAAPSDLTPQLLGRAIKAEAHALFGDCGAGALERTLTVKYFSRPTSTFILRVTREQLRYVWTALTCMRQVPTRSGRPCVFRVARVGGTIRKVEEEAIRQARALILATKAYMAGNTASAYDLLTRATAGQGAGRRRKDFLADVVSEGEDGDDGDDGDDDDDDDDDGGDGQD